MDPKQPSFGRPSTLGQAWQKMSQPRGRKVADLPPLPDWPPLPGEPYRGVWPPLDEEPAPPATPATPGEPRVPEAEQQAGSGKAGSGKAARPRRLPEIPWRKMDALGRWRRMSKRMRLGIAAAIVVSMVLIAACASLAIGVAGNLGSSVSTSLSGAAATQQAPGQGSASSGSLTVTPSPSTTSTLTPTSTASLPLTLTFTCASGSLRGTGKVCVHTAPSANLSIAVRYCDGSTAKGLHSAAVADSSGNYTWSWPVHMTCAGPATATVFAKWNGETVTATKSFTITA